MKYLGIDYGTKRIGIATSDADGTLAFPLATVQTGEKALGEIIEIINREEIEAIVLGESLNLSGTENKVQKQIEKFKKDLSGLALLPVHYEPEFMSSAGAARQFAPKTKSQPKSRKANPSQDKLDAAAAALILQSYLDRLKNNGAN